MLFFFPLIVIKALKVKIHFLEKKIIRETLKKIV